MSQQMKSRSTAKTLLTISLSIGVAIVVCFIVAVILEFPTNRGAIYTFFGATSLFGLLFAPLPCLILSLIGTIKAWRGNMKRLVMLGIAETIIWAIVLVFAYTVFMMGMSV